MKALTCLLAMLGASACAAAFAASSTAYRCTDASGAISFQDKPCGSGQQSQSFEYQRDPPPAPADPAASPDPAATTAEAEPEPPASVPAPPPPRPPVPPVFKCVRADNDKIYYSDTGETRPYQVPAGVLGLPGGSLGSSAAPSAPELNRPGVAAPSIAAGYVEVRDRCEPLSPAEACRVLRGQLDENLARQRKASREDREGLAREAHALADKVAGC